MDSRISCLIDSLPTLTKDDVDIHDHCPICFVDFKTILDHNDSDRTEPAGLTRLLGCSHVFCKKDLVQWIRSWHGSCPTCRDIFLSNLHPRSESDDESDGGEYDPNDYDDYEEQYEEQEDDSFDDESDLYDEDIEDEDEDEDEEEFEEEDDQAMGLLDPASAESYHPDWIEVAVANPANEQVARLEAALLESIVEAEEEAIGHFDEDTLAEEEAYSRFEEECSLPDWDLDSEGLSICVAASSEPELLEDIRQVGDDVGAYLEPDQR